MTSTTRFRRLAKDYERLPGVLACLDFISFARLAVIRPHPSSPSRR
jgi:hypothetical protein